MCVVGKARKWKQAHSPSATNDQNSALVARLLLVQIKNASYASDFQFFLVKIVFKFLRISPTHPIQCHKANWMQLKPSFCIVLCSVVDPDSDPHSFGCPGSGSVLGMQILIRIQFATLDLLFSTSLTHGVQIATKQWLFLDRHDIFEGNTGEHNSITIISSPYKYKELLNWNSAPNRNFF